MICGEISSFLFGRLITYRSVAAGRTKNEVWWLKSISQLLYSVVAMLAFTVCLTLIYAVKEISNTGCLKIDWKAMNFLSIATVHCWALTWSWWSGFSQHLIYSACVCVCVCTVCLPLSVSLFICRRRVPRRCLFGWVHLCGNPELGVKQLWQTLAPVKPNNSLSVVSRSNPHIGMMKNPCMRIQLSMHVLLQ